MVHTSRVAFHFACRYHLWFAMSFVAADNFLQREGREMARKLKKMANEGRTLTEMAKALGVTIQRASIVRKTVIKPVWIYTGEMVEALERDRRVSEDDAQEIDEMLEENRQDVLKVKTPVYEINNRA